MSVRNFDWKSLQNTDKRTLSIKIITQDALIIN